ncbi:uncharacterized protein LOC126381178 [Pectinophora gossypiella]|uniref:uncharacterized protein LOC126381178 n=1 Tax=Pectinophora gossypiella TaxID=13191 RepID=UPI00214F1FD5|nr:uncharacterized protein LOC126381178 [Pectinophora gossypiella]
MDHAQVHTSMDKMIKMFDTKMAEFQAELNQATRKNPSTIAALNAEFQTFKAFVCNGLNVLRGEVKALARGVDRIEMKSRRKMLLVHGVPEKKNEDIASVVTSSLSAKIKVPNFNVDCLRTCHRMGKVTNNSGKLRPIVLKFTDMAMRDSIWNTKTALKGSKITVSEFLTKSRHSVFMAARDKYGISNCWTRDGFIFIKTPDSAKQRVESLAELLVLPAPTANVATVP